MSKPRILDLCCGAGGMSMGFHMAGFEVVGVDNVGIKVHRGLGNRTHGILQSSHPYCIYERKARQVGPRA